MCARQIPSGASGKVCLAVAGKFPVIPKGYCGLVYLLLGIPSYWWNYGELWWNYGELWCNYGGIMGNCGGIMGNCGVIMGNHGELWGFMDAISCVDGCCLFLLCGPLIPQTFRFSFSRQCSLCATLLPIQGT